MCKLSLVQSSSSDFGGFQTRSSYKHRWKKANPDTLLAFQKPAPKAQEKADGLSFGQETSVWPISTNDHRKLTKRAAFWQTLRPSALRNPKLVPVRRPNLTNLRLFWGWVLNVEPSPSYWTFKIFESLKRIFPKRRWLKVTVAASVKGFIFYTTSFFVCVRNVCTGKMLKFHQFRNSFKHSSVPKPFEASWKPLKRFGSHQKLFSR